VRWAGETPAGGHGSSFSFPGDRDSIRRRSVVASLHLVRRMLEQNGDDFV
jgi:nicotinamide mononucleotide (NMN) deamidase PncC